MKVDKRQTFLDIFLGLLGVDEVEIAQINGDKVYGVAKYNDDEEGQEFCWHMTEAHVPSDDVIHLIKVIRDNQFNRTDKLVVPDAAIFEKSGWADRTRFNSAYDRLFDIEVKMIDNGEETDSYFLHD